jgi:hypothetical protein
VFKAIPHNKIVACINFKDSKSIPRGMKMKKLCFACMCLSLIGMAEPVMAEVDGLQILSQQYHVTGSYGVWSDLDLSWHTDSYNLNSADSSGISGLVSTENIPGLEYALAKSSAGQFFAYAEAESFDASSGATASISFQPVSSGRLFAYLDTGLGYTEATLTDSTAGVALLTCSGGMLTNGNWWIESSHNYSLFLSASSDMSVGSSAGYAHADLSFIPEPCTLLLLGFGAAILRSGAKSRFSRRKKH